MANSVLKGEVVHLINNVMVISGSLIPKGNRKIVINQPKINFYCIFKLNTPFKLYLNQCIACVGFES